MNDDRKLILEVLKILERAVDDIGKIAQKMKLNTDSDSQAYKVSLSPVIKGKVIGKDR